ncbi:MAG: orotidine-5'-phosphate decarboxylase [Pirellulaceae bacterium]|nr:orotidine-5'-phosphate decarboxylase [Pirellulaceae bacterium]
MDAFSDRLAGLIEKRRTPVLVGLDPRAGSLPAGMIASPDTASPTEVAAAYTRFCRAVIDVVAPLVPAVKPQAAFFEELGPAGMSALAEVIAHARKNNLLVILDAKRNDIGSTATAYAHGMLGAHSPWGADCMTVSPYLGADSLQPFVDVAVERGAGVFVLVKTSNPGGGMLQDLECDGTTVYEHVARYVEERAAETASACGYGAIGAVVGATYPDQLTELRERMPHAWILVPGFGSQGGTARDVAGAFDPRGLGALVNNSRGIIFAHSRQPYNQRFGDERWQEAVEAATLDMIEQLRAETLAGRLG